MWWVFLERGPHQSGVLALWGMLAGSGVRETMLFRSGDVAAVRSLLASDPALRDGHLVARVFPQYLGVGVLGTDHLAGFGWLRELVGSCWSGSVAGSDTRRTECFESRFGRFLSGRSRIETSEETFEWESVLRRGEAGGTIDAWYWASNGDTGRSRATLQGEVATMEDIADDGTPTGKRDTWQRLGPDSWRLTHQRLLDGVWVEDWHVDLSRLDP